LGGELIIGDNHCSAIGTLVERQTRMVRLVHLPRSDSDSLHAALVTRMQDLPAGLMRSITWDQGTEMGEIVNTCGSGCSGDLRSGLFGAVGGRLCWGDLGGAFEQFALVEDRAGADQSDQVWGVDGAPAGRGGVDELVGHGQTSRT
jgi:hypothetical protein